MKPNATPFWVHDNHLKPCYSDLPPVRGIEDESQHALKEAKGKFEADKTDTADHNEAIHAGLSQQNTDTTQLVAPWRQTHYNLRPRH